jgi:hypothetical protein
MLSFIDRLSKLISRLGARAIPSPCYGPRQSQNDQRHHPAAYRRYPLVDRLDAPKESLGATDTLARAGNPIELCTSAGAWARRLKLP